MASTKNGIIYPDNYDKVADVPADMKTLAESVDENIEKINKNINEDVDALKDIQNDISLIKQNNTIQDNKIKEIEDKNNEQDTNIKTNQEDIKALQEENEEVKAENERLKSDIESISLVGEAEGESVDLEDSSEARLRKFGIGGNHKQESRSGKNRLQIPFEDGSSNGLSWVVNDDGTIILNGTTTASAHITKDYVKINANEGETVTLSAEGFENIFNLGYKNITTGNNILIIDSSRPTQTKTLTSDDLSNANRLDIYIQSGKTFNNQELKIMIEEGSAATEYEQYGAMPSPNFQSEVKTAGSNINLLDESKASPKMANGMTFSYSENEGLKLNGTTTALTNFWILNLREKLGTGNYILSSSVNLENKGTYALKDINGNLAQGNLKQARTFKCSETTTTDFLIQINSGVTFDNQIFKIKLEKGSKATPYSAYGQGSVKVKVVNKNYLNTKDINDTGAGITIKGNKSNVKTTGTSTSTWKASNFIELENLEAGEYIFSYKSEKGLTYRLWISNSNKSATIFNTTGKFSVHESYKNVFYRLVVEGLSAGQTIDDTVYIQLEKNSTATDFVEHQEQAITMPAQQEMLKGDYFDWNNGKEVHNWKKMILTGNESDWVYEKDSNWTRFSRYNLTTNIDFERASRSICSHFGKYEKYASKENSFAVGTNMVRFNADLLSFSTVEEWKEYLKQQYDAGTPVTIYYQLLTPTELDFTDEQKTVAKQIKETLHTYKNVTHIYSDDEVSPIVNVEYAKDPNTQNNNLQEQIDEIKQLISTTQTSAMLLDNLQKEVESEVE